MLVITDMVCCDYYSHRNFTKKFVSQVNSDENGITLITTDYIVVIITLIAIHKLVLLIDSNKSDITLITIDYINII